VLRRCGETDCVITELGPAHPGVLSVEVDAESIYLSLAADTLSKVPLAGGAGEFLAPTYQMARLTADASHLYWTEFHGQVMRVSKDGGASEPFVYADGHPTALVVDESHLYVTIPDRSELAAVDLGSAQIRRLSGQAAPSDVTHDGSHVYWVNEGDGDGTGQLVRAPRGDIAAAEVLQSGLARPYRVAVDAARVYWLASGRLFAAEKAAGSPPEELLSGLGEIHTVRAFEGVVYLAGEPGLLRVAGGAPSLLDPRLITGLTLDCSGVYATGWYESFLIRYGD
jgi:hypothetical protein